MRASAAACTCADARFRCACALIPTVRAPVRSFCSLHQKDRYGYRDEKEEAAFLKALKVMGLFYASIAGPP